MLGLHPCNAPLRLSPPASGTSSPPSSPINLRNPPFLDRSSSCSSAAGGFEESIKNVVERRRRSCDVKVENVTVDKCRVNEDVDVVFRQKGRDRVGRKLRLFARDLASGRCRGREAMGNGDVSSVDLSKEVVKLRENDLTEVRESDDKVSRRSCDAVLVRDGRGSFDNCRGLAGKPRASLDVNLVERSSGFWGLKLAVSDVSDVKEVDNLVVKRSANGKNLKPIVRSGISQVDCVQDSDDSSEGLVSKRLRRGLDRIICNMKVLSPLQVKKVRETSSSRSSPNGAKASFQIADYRERGDGDELKDSRLLRG